MNRLFVPAALAIWIFSFTAASAAEKTVTLAVKNMNCATCPYTVRASLEVVPGVTRVAVSYKDKTATVTYDNSKTGVTALTAATTNAGYPSQPRN